jgi:hypothetical protein
MKEKHEPSTDWWFIENPSSKSLSKSCQIEIEPKSEFTFIVVLKS